MVPPNLKAVAYGIADRLAPRGLRRSVNGEQIRWPAAWLRYYPREYQTTTHAFLARHVASGSLAVDAGAHIGLFTVVMARRAGPGGHIVSIEPSFDSADVLDQVISLNGLEEQVTVCRAPVSDASVESDFFVAPYAAYVGNSLVQTSLSDRVERRTTTTIDELVAGYSLPVSCLKIDVEASEEAVLRGSHETIGTNRPALALDIHASLFERREQSLLEIWGMLATYGYDVLHENEVVSRSWFLSRHSIFEAHALPRA